jgi:predicted acyl esterase
VIVPADSYRYPDEAWSRHTSPDWPPPGIAETRLELGSDGIATPSGAAPGSLPLAPYTADPANDPVAAAAFSATPLGTSPIPRQVPALQLPGFVAGFETAPLAEARELSGSPRADLSWTPLSTDSQVVVKLFDRAPDGTMMLLSRGVTGVRGATPGTATQITVPLNAASALIGEGHALTAWVTAGDAPFYKPFVPSLGGVLGAGPDSALSVPLGAPR